MTKRLLTTKNRPPKWTVESERRGGVRLLNYGDEQREHEPQSLAAPLPICPELPPTDEARRLNIGSPGTLTAMEPVQLSPSAHERLVEELTQRSGPMRFEIAEKIERARELGDLKENADYDAAKNEQGLNEARVRQLEAMLRDAEIVDSASGDVVEVGTIVEIRIGGDDATQSYLIGSIEERNDDFDVLSTSSPLGQVLIGRSVGDSATYETPRKAQLGVEVVSIRPL